VCDRLGCVREGTLHPRIVFTRAADALEIPATVGLRLCSDCAGKLSGAREILGDNIDRLAKAIADAGHPTSAGDPRLEWTAVGEVQAPAATGGVASE
jgi:hypothetical protein